MFLDDIDDNDVPQVDPTKLDFVVEPKFLDREIIIRVKVADDANFNNMVKCVDLIKQAFDEEIQALKDSWNVTP